MDDVRDVLINLIAAAIGAVTAWGYARIRRWRQQRRARRFWGPMASRGIIIVVSPQDRTMMDRWEPSGLIGMGDLVGLVSLQQQLQRIGCPVTVSTIEALNPEDHERDLVLLGGPDTNSLARRMLEHYDGKLTITVPGWRDHAVAFADTTTGKSYPPRQGEDGTYTADYGFVTRLPNYLANGRSSEVLILAGCWGFGTAGAAEAVGDADFLEHVAAEGNRCFESLVHTEVHLNSAHYTHPVLVRGVDTESATLR
ncbi:hypothetical protein GCM10009828_022870 [Actinoplanes couchii]|uniref:S-layer protein C-terminal domain-containing protein n=2 Tax=Actinoplanes couchii TaxID=403638 RepID=A0ABQ3XTX9_9ACTN|nr:hypothetical protein Aco03nite_102560 [Actinoplanes couchii]